MLNALYYPKVRLYDALYIPHILQDIYIKGSYRDFFKEDTRYPCVVDFGANCGLTAQYFREYADRVYAVEPCPDQFEALKNNKEYNRWDNVEIFNMAVAGENGEGDFHINRSNMTAGSLDNPFYSILSTSDMEYETVSHVRKVTIDTFFSENNIGAVDFLKMDIEGQEDEVIRSKGFSEVLPKIKGMLIEFHNQNWEQTLSLIPGFYSKRLPVDTVSYLFSREDLWH